MGWIADLHIHSHFSMATSKESNPQNLYRWAGLKGVSLVGTGDFTHPGWRKELRGELVAAEPGFYTMREKPVPEIPDQEEVRFVVTGELSTIYKKNGRVRKVHHLVVLPSLEDADRISAKLEELGMNIRSDGRPILGLDSQRLFELILNVSPDVIFIPAHIWTPHFSVFGSNSGFDAIEDCYEDLTPYIFALETGLSSDPGMNWRWSALDRFTLISNSDAHNPRNLAREANIFEAEFSYDGLKKALQVKDSGKFSGTIEFFPEEGKYHCDGHRNCEVCWKPEETTTNSGVCPVCGRPVTVGVLHRVVKLADRPEGFRPGNAAPYQNLIPLREVIASALGAGAASKKVEQAYYNLLQKFGPELTILQKTEFSDLAKNGGPLIAEGIKRLRRGEVEIKPGYDGEYGVISVLREDERRALKGQAAIFEIESSRPLEKNSQLQQAVAAMIKEAKSSVVENNIYTQAPATGKSELSAEQLAVIKQNEKTAIVIAGPGTGKTRTLVERIAYLIRELGVNPEEITGVTFTNKAAAEMKARISNILLSDKRINKLNLGTFHGLSWKILNRNPEPFTLKLLDEEEAKDLLEEVLRQNRFPMSSREASLIISLIKNKYLWDNELQIPQKVIDLYHAYQEILQLYQRLDFDDLIIKTVALWEENPEWLQPYKSQFKYLLIDEFQDISAAQYRLVKLWAASSHSIMVIGDPNQAIYSFRGASSCFFDRLKNDFAEANLFKLTRNYRSPSFVVEASNSLVGAIYHQTTGAGGDADIQECDMSSQSITWLEVPSEKSAAKVVTGEIISLLGGSTMLSAHAQSWRGKKLSTVDTAYSLSDIAILYRTGRQAEAIEFALSTEGLPYRVVGKKSTFEVSQVKEFLIFFRYLMNPNDSFLLRAALRLPRWGFTNGETAEVLKIFNGQMINPSETNTGFSTALLNKLHQFYGVVEYYRLGLERKNEEIISDWILRMDLGEIEEMEHLQRISENYRDLRELIQFLPLALEADIVRKGNKTSGTEAITLTTIHAAKGLEFPVVFIAGVEEGLLPIGNEPDEETVTEEQRLFYVGLTRARQCLYLINSQYRLQQGESVPTQVSRFLKMLPASLIEKVEWHKHNRSLKQLELFS